MSIPIPCSRVLIDGKELEIFRCRADGGLIFHHQDLLRLHPGHTFSSPVILNEEDEKQLIEIYSEIYKKDQDGKKES